jgi:nuclear pore complex protein Nup98-Nup96
MQTQPAPMPQPPQMPQPVPWGDLLNLSNGSSNVPVQVAFPPQPPPPPMPSVEWPSWPLPQPVTLPQVQRQQQAQLLVQPMQPPMQPVQPPPPQQPQLQPVHMQPARPATKLEPAPKLPAQRKSPARQATPPPPTRAVPADMTPPRSNLRELFFRDDLRAMPPPASKAAATQTAEDELAAAAAAVTLHQTGVPQAAAMLPAPMPTLRDPSLYWCTPTLAELAAAEAARPGALSSVEGFVLGARGHGHIRFLAPVDLRGAPQLDDVVTFEKRAIAVYARGSGPPPPGQGLNVATEVTLLDVFPSSRRSPSSSGSDNEGAEGTEATAKKAGRFLRKLQAAAGTRFVAYDAATGTWRFKLEHF